MKTKTNERQNPTGGQPAGLQDTATGLILNVPKSQSKSQSYAEVAAAAEYAEYAWITNEADQKRSDELDRVLRVERACPVYPKWTNIYREHGRATACAELMFEQFNIKMDQTRRKEADAVEDRRAVMSQEMFEYIEQREQFCKQPGRTYDEVWALDVKFLKDQEAKGHSKNEWISQFGDTFSSEIETRQNSEQFWRDERRRVANNKRLEQQAEAERRRRKDQADQRQADKFAQAVASAAETMLQGMLRDIISSGVLRGK